MFYVFATPERGIISPDDLLISRRDTKASAIAFAKACEAVETYVMNDNDFVVWESWPDIDAAIAASK